MPSDDNPKKRDSKPFKLPFLARTQAMGSSGWEAYTVGFTLVGCIAAGAGLGYWLDSHFKTNIWLPILFLVGVGAGFREMWVVIKRLDREEERQKREKQAAIKASPMMPPPRASPPVEPPKAERKRLFEVPPPPFEMSGEGPKQASNPERSDEILRRLLAESDDEEQDTK